MAIMSQLKFFTYPLVSQSLKTKTEKLRLIEVALYNKRDYPKPCKAIIIIAGPRFIFSHSVDCLYLIKTLLKFANVALHYMHRGINLHNLSDLHACSKYKCKSN